METDGYDGNTQEIWLGRIRTEDAVAEALDAEKPPLPADLRRMIDEGDTADAIKALNKRGNESRDPQQEHVYRPQ